MYKTGILKNIKLEHSPVATMKLFQYFWGTEMSLSDAKKLVDHIIKHKELDLKNGFYFISNGKNNYIYNMPVSIFLGILSGEFVESKYGDLKKGLVLSKSGKAVSQW